MIVHADVLPLEERVRRSSPTFGRLPRIAPELGSAVMAERERWLGPESRRWWKGLIAFWSGEAPAVLAVDD